MELRREVAEICQLYRIVEGTATAAVRHAMQPKFVANSMQRSTRNVESLNLRAIEMPWSRTLAHQRSYFPHFAASAFRNNLDDEAVFSPTMKIFKKRASTRLRTQWRS